MSRHLHRLDPRRALSRLAIALAFGTVASAAIAPQVTRIAAVLVGWDAACVVALALSWAIIGPANAETTRDRAGAEDPGRTLVYVIVVLASAFSVLAAAALVRGVRVLPTDVRDATITLCLASVALAWTMTHTAFALRYAHLYYREDDEGVGGVVFPGERPPTYADFAYFAFTIGMCFQVSDASVTSSHIRRGVLLHAVISFAYNSVILAFVLNLVFGLAA